LGAQIFLKNHRGIYVFSHKLLGALAIMLGAPSNSPLLNMGLGPRLAVHFPIWLLFLQFSTIIFKGNETPENAPSHQVFKIKTE